MYHLRQQHLVAIGAIAVPEFVYTDGRCLSGPFHKKGPPCTALKKSTLIRELL